MRTIAGRNAPALPRRGFSMLHRLSSTPETVRFGMFDAAFAPVLTVRSGDTITVECVSGGPEVMPTPEQGLSIPPAPAGHPRGQARAHRPAHPDRAIAVEGAEPGDTLEVRIEAVTPAVDWGLLRRAPPGRNPARGFPPTGSSATSGSTATASPASRTGGRNCRWRPSSAPWAWRRPPVTVVCPARSPASTAATWDNKELTAGSTPVPAGVGSRRQLLRGRRARAAGRR